MLHGKGTYTCVHAGMFKIFRLFRTGLKSDVLRPLKFDVSENISLSGSDIQPMCLVTKAWSLTLIRWAEDVYVLVLFEGL